MESLAAIFSYTKAFLRILMSGKRYFFVSGGLHRLCGWVERGVALLILLDAEAMKIILKETLGL